MLNLESHTPCVTTVEVLTEIWQRVLRRNTNINPEDEFRDLGGNDRLVDQLFAEIARVFHLPNCRALQSRHATTIAALAALLELPTRFRNPFPPIVKLKAGAGKTSVFIAHGLDGRREIL